LVEEKCRLTGSEWRSYRRCPAQPLPALRMGFGREVTPRNFPLSTKQPLTKPDTTASGLQSKRTIGEIKMKKTMLIFAASTALMFGAQTFTGTITDDMCSKADHQDMKMGSDEKCVTECIKTMGGKYVLYDGSKTYNLSDQKTPAKFAAKKVTVTGTLDPKTNTIKVDSIAAAH
jgi:hypothetical protein